MRQRSAQTRYTSVGISGAGIRLGSRDERALRLGQEVLLSAAVRFLANAGLPRKSIVERLRALARSVEAVRNVRTVHSEGYDLFARVSGVVHDWTRSPDYTGTDGEPRALSCSGRRSLSVLIRKRCGRRPIAPVLRWMRARGVIRRRRDGRYVLLRRAVIAGHLDPVYLEWAATVAAHFLETALENWKERDPEARQVDRVARVFNLPEREASNFRLFAKKRAESWLEEIDNWLEDHDAPGGRLRRVEAGVHVHGYVRSASANAT
jgi:Family of unknown function (DUF6502)